MSALLDRVRCRAVAHSGTFKWVPGVCWACFPLFTLQWFSCSQVVELKFGGKDIPVTSANRIAYIHLVADYRLNRQIRQHCLAFRQGLANVVSLEWLRMFDQQEIQVCCQPAPASKGSLHICLHPHELNLFFRC